MSNDDLFPLIRKLIFAEIGYPIERITLDTRLQADTGMAGDDGADFLDRFQREFTVDMASLRYDEHFEPEGIPLFVGFGFVFAAATSAFLPWLIPIWAGIGYFLWQRARSRTAQIRVSDLLRSAELHRWSYDYTTAIDRNASQITDQDVV